jgi:hypothetical protein
LHGVILNFTRPKGAELSLGQVPYGFLNFPDFWPLAQSAVENIGDLLSGTQAFSLIKKNKNLLPNIFL